MSQRFASHPCSCGSLCVSGRFDIVRLCLEPLSTRPFQKTVVSWCISRVDELMVRAKHLGLVRMTRLPSRISPAADGSRRLTTVANGQASRRQFLRGHGSWLLAPCFQRGFRRGDFFKGRNLPQRHVRLGAQPGACSQGAAIGRESERQATAGERLQRRHFLLRCDVPQLHLAFVTAGRERLAIRREGDASDEGNVSLERGFEVSGRDFPKPRSVVN